MVPVGQGDLVADLLPINARATGDTQPMRPCFRIGLVLADNAEDFGAYRLRLPA